MSVAAIVVGESIAAIEPLKKLLDALGGGARVTKGTNLVRLTPEVARLFPTEAAVNNALLSLAELSKSLPDLTGRSKRAARKRAAA